MRLHNACARLFLASMFNARFPGLAAEGDVRERMQGTGRPGAPLTRSARAFARDAAHCRVLAVPAALYAVNNYLKFVMQLFFKPTAAKMIGNLKVLAIALLMRAVLRRRFSTLQWEALFLLVAGISINQLANCDAAQPFHMSAAAAAVTLASVTVPSCASVFNEYGFKKDKGTSVHLQNFFLYFWGMLLNGAGMLVLDFITGERLGQLFRGLSGWVLCLVAVNAAQGVLASFFYKFADTILKKYSSTLATILTGAAPLLHVT
jgi:Nucleotide-sugar transporter